MGTSHGPSLGKKFHIPQLNARMSWELSESPRLRGTGPNMANQLCYQNYWDDLGKFMDKNNQNHEVTHTPPRIFEYQDPEEKQGGLAGFAWSFPSPTAKSFQGPVGWIGFKLVTTLLGPSKTGFWWFCTFLEAETWFECWKRPDFSSLLRFRRASLVEREMVWGWVNQRFGEREIKYIAKSAFGQWESLMNEFLDRF